MGLGSAGERAMWAVLIVLVLGYLIGSWLNRRRSMTLGKWLQAGLTGLGGTSTWRWVRSINSGAEATVTGLSRPLRSLRAGYFLLTRELPILWGIELLRGRRDLLSLRADLHPAPAAEFELVPARGRLRRQLERESGDAPWNWQEMPHRLALATRGSARPNPQALQRFAEKYGPHLERLSVRKRQPHLILFLRLGPVEQAPAAELLAAVRRLAEAYGKAAAEH